MAVIRDGASGLKWVSNERGKVIGEGVTRDAIRAGEGTVHMVPIGRWGLASPAVDGGNRWQKQAVLGRTQRA